MDGSGSQGTSHRRVYGPCASAVQVVWACAWCSQGGLISGGSQTQPDPPRASWQLSFLPGRRPVKRGIRPGGPCIEGLGSRVRPRPLSGRHRPLGPDGSRIRKANGGRCRAQSVLAASCDSWAQKGGLARCRCGLPRDRPHKAPMTLEQLGISWDSPKNPQTRPRTMKESMPDEEGLQEP